MAVLNFSLSGLPLVSQNGFTSGDAAQGIPSGASVWNPALIAGTITANGTYTGTAHPTVGIIWEGPGLTPREDFVNVSASGGSWSCSNQALAIAPSQYAASRSSLYLQARFDASAWTSCTLLSANINFDGVPNQPEIAPGPAVRIFPGVLGNLYFEVPVISPLELQPGPGPVTFPDYTLGPGSFETVWTPGGYVMVPTTGGGQYGTDQVRGRKRMACLRRKGHIYLNVGPTNLPAVIPVQLIGDAQWLKFTPGLANIAGAAGNGNLGIRIYSGLGQQFSQGKWTTGYAAIAQAPDWVGNGSFADLFPWERPMQFLIELTGLGASIPAASLFEFCFDGFDLG